ncbi:MAG: hypothetical protein IJJ22_06430 [Oscillospiraceae bacterium]|nr:hypothetical protein [Oscillospiraceae bacterium]
MKRTQLTSFFLEALLLVTAFVAMILVLTGVFGTAHAQSAEAGLLSQAVALASNAAEAANAADSPEMTAALLDEGGNVLFENGTIEAFYNADGSSCPSGTGKLRLTLTWEPAATDDPLIKNRISIYNTDKETVIYTLETAKYQKEAEK